MNYLVIVISILLSVICVLLALLQHYYFISKIDKKSPIKYDVPVFEDLIPSENDKKVQILYPIQKLSYDDDPHEDDLVLNQLTSVLEPEKVDARNVIDTTKYRGFDSEVYNTLQAAIAFKLSGKTHKALKLFEHAAAIAPENADVLNKYGEFLEQTQRDIVTADEFYFKVNLDNFLNVCYIMCFRL